MARRAVGGLVLVLLGALLAPSAAVAGTYTVHACRTPAGAAAPADGWTAGVGGAYMYAGIGCPSGPMSASADPATAHARGSTLSLRFDAPPQTHIAAYDVRRSVRVTAGSGWAWNYTTFVNAANFTTSDLRESCWSSSGCGELAGAWAGAGPASALILLIDCSSGLPADCQAGGRAEMSVASAAVTLEDASDPVFVGVPSGTALDTGKPVSGLVGASFSAVDEGGGLARAVLEVDGAVVAEAPLAGPACREPYTQVVPCKPSAGGTVSWDTRTVPNGVHQVRLLVYDATGTNHASAGPFAVRVRNAEALACQPSALVVEAGWRGRAHRTVGFHRRSRITGRVLGSDGAPAAGTQVSLFDAATGRRLRVAAARRDGRYAMRAPASRTRQMRVAVQTGAASFACSRRLMLRVRSGLSLAVRPRAVRNGERVRLRGRVRGGALPPKGKLVELQALEGGDWRTFASLRTDERGRFATRYRFQRTFTARTYRFRARARAEARFPFVLGVSRSATVRVTP
jgi:5-hydroxyisourate hydrolase-like protein (transthyretin family)